MSGIRILVLALLAAGILLHGNDADAQARQPLQFDNLAYAPVEMDVWLRRLVGRYIVFEGVIQVPRNGECGSPGSSALTQPCQKIKGTGECVSVGTGPGVQCMFNVSWLDIWIMNFDSGDFEPAGVSYLDPAMLLFGLDPGKAAINHLLVNKKGLPEGGLGTNKGNWATFRTSCVNEPGIVGGCERIFRIEAKPNSPLVYVWIDVEKGEKDTDPPELSIQLSLRRVAQDEGGKDKVVDDQ